MHPSVNLVSGAVTHLPVRRRRSCSSSMRAEQSCTPVKYLPKLFPWRPAAQVRGQQRAIKALGDAYRVAANIEERVPAQRTKALAEVRRRLNTTLLEIVAETHSSRFSGTLTAEVAVCRQQLRNAEREGDVDAFLAALSSTQRRYGERHGGFREAVPVRKLSRTERRQLQVQVEAGEVLMNKFPKAKINRVQDAEDVGF